MNARQIFEEVLLLDKRIILEFQTEKDFERFRGALRAYKSKLSEALRGLGEAATLDKKVIVARPVDEGRSIPATGSSVKCASIRMEFYLVDAKPLEACYKIISVDGVESNV